MSFCRTSPVMAVRLRAPSADGDILCVPPVGAWEQIARDNRAALAGETITIGGAPFAHWRLSARRQTLARAVAYTRSLGESPPDAMPDGLLVGTGHQPVFFHPGIWIKNWIVEACASADVATLNLVVDTDETGTVAVRAPRRNGHVAQTRRDLLAAPPGAPFEAVAPPTPAAWRTFVDTVRGDVATLALPAVAARLDATAAAGAAALANASDLGDFLTRVRRALQRREAGAQRTLEVPVSHVASTPAFREFCGAWIARFDAHWEAVNAAMNAHRLAERVRSAAQPFPNLGRIGDRLELPFWVVRGGERLPLLARRAGGRIEVGVGDEPLASAPAEEWESGAAIGDLALRPRALTLTLFARLGVVDLFVHGIGGARYDRATDRVARAVFGFDPPPFAVATATFHLPLGGADDVLAERRGLERRLLALAHNPERFLADGSRAALVEEKWRHIRSLSSGALTRRQRRDVTGRIREINAHLASGLEAERAAATRELEMWTARQAEQAAARDREYPYFLFDADDLARAARRLVVERAAR